MKFKKNAYFPFIFMFFILQQRILFCQDYSIARTWNEVILESIRNDFARPTVHARNLFHMSAMMYDMDSVDKSTPFLNNDLNGNYIPYDDNSIKTMIMPS